MVHTFCDLISYINNIPAQLSISTLLTYFRLHCLTCILYVIHIIDSVYALIYTACAPRGYMHSSCVYEPIYTVNNLYNDFIILQDVFVRWKVCFLHFTWNLVLFSSYHNWPKFPAWSLTIQHRHATLLSTYDVI